MPLPWPNYREHVQRAVDVIRVSHRPNHGYQGAIHEATAWGLRKDGKAVRREPREGSSVHEIKVKSAESMIPISSTRNTERHGKDSDGRPKAYKAYLGGSNYCIEIIANEKGKWQGKVVTTYQAYQLVRKFGEKEGWKRLRDRERTLCDKPLVMRLTIGDMLSLVNNEKKVLMRVCQIKQSGQIVLAQHNEANVDARNRDKDNHFKYTFKSAGSLQKAQACFATVSPIGNVKVYH